MNITDFFNIAIAINEDEAYRRNASIVFKELKWCLDKYVNFESVILSSEAEIFDLNNFSKLCYATRVILSDAGIEFKFSFCKTVDLISLMKADGYVEITPYQWTNGHFTCQLRKQNVPL